MSLVEQWRAYWCKKYHSWGTSFLTRAILNNSIEHCSFSILCIASKAMFALLIISQALPTSRVTSLVHLSTLVHFSALKKELRAVISYKPIQCINSATPCFTCAKFDITRAAFAAMRPTASFSMTLRALYYPSSIQAKGSKWHFLYFLW